MALIQFNEFEPKLAGLEGNMQAEPRVFAHDAVAVVIGAVNNSDANHGLAVTDSGSGYAVNDTITLSSPAAGGVPQRAVATVSATDAVSVNLTANVNRSLLGATTIAFVGATNTSYTDLEPGVSAGVTTTSAAGTGLKMSLTVAGGIATILTITEAGTGYVDGDTILFGTGTFGGAITMVITLGKGKVTNYSITTPGSLYVQDEAFTQAATSSVGINFAGNVSNIDIPNTQRRGCCLYIGNSGDVEVIMEGGNTVVFVGVATGAFLPILVKQVVTTNTDATDILALY